MASRAAFQTALEQFSDVRWRLNNLYWIIDKEGQRVRFEMNWAQERLFDSMHYLNVILKARQLGFTTLIQLFMLDKAVFNSNTRCGSIAHTLLDAQTIFREKILTPYNGLPDQIRAAVSVVTSNSQELLLSNNSSIRVGTSLRSGTLHCLHVSEYGKLCAKFPEKAREVRTGALNTIQAGQLGFIESTAEGQEGHFFDLCTTAQAKQRIGTKLTPLDFEFHFFPWWENKEYEIDPAGVVISEQFDKYFDKLAKLGILLNDRKRAWYAKKAETQLGDMKREYPSTAAEAFEAAVEGAYYAAELAKLELRSGVGIFPADPRYFVHAAWDIGHHDDTAIWFFQKIGGRIRIVGYYQESGRGLPTHAAEIKKLAAERGWTLGQHIWPHDGRQTEWGSGLGRVEQALKHGLNVMIGADLGLQDGINAVRAVLPICEFDEAATVDGRKALAAYRKEWSDDRGMWLDEPWHGWPSHGADAFRYLAVSHHMITTTMLPDARRQLTQGRPRVWGDLDFDDGPKGPEVMKI